MTRKKKVLEFGDGKSAAAGTDTDLGEAPVVDGHADKVFDAPLDDAAVIARLIELNHERMECDRRWDAAKTEASEAKKELDAVSNAISLLIDQVDRQRSGDLAGQPVLRTLTTAAAGPQ